MGIYIYASTATGKTTVARKYVNIIDMESTRYKYLNYYDDESKKSTDRILNPNWPNNYFEELVNVKDKYDYILIADEICNEFLWKNNYEYWQIYPALDLKSEYMERCKKRGNNKDFINWYSELWEQWYYQCKNDEKARKHIELKCNQYLEDVLPNLIKRSDYKNK